MATRTVEEVLEAVISHHGTKGMKWGIRKKRAARPAFDKPAIRAKKLSDSDLKVAIQRMQLEKQYTDLSKKSSRSGGKYVLSLLESAGRTAVGVVAAGAAGKAVKKALNT